MNTHSFDIDELLCRVLEGDASADCWRELAAHAACDDRVWARVASELAQSRMIERRVHELTAPAERIEIPQPQAEPAARGGLLPIALRRRAAWSGWAVAACFLVAFVLLRPGSTAAPDRGDDLIAGETAAPMDPAAFTATEALRAYVRAGTDEGLLVGELPIVAVRTTPAAQGAGVEVVYMRRFLERTFVDDGDIVRLASDEHGRAVTLPARDESSPRRNSL